MFGVVWGIGFGMVQFKSFWAWILASWLGLGFGFGGSRLISVF